MKGPLLRIREEQKVNTAAYARVWGLEHGAGLDASGNYDKRDLGKGLDNPKGNNNCFLNTIIQSLWQLEGFRKPLLAMVSCFVYACVCMGGRKGKQGRKGIILFDRRETPHAFSKTIFHISSQLGDCGKPPWHVALVCARMHVFVRVHV